MAFLKPGLCLIFSLLCLGFPAICAADNLVLHEEEIKAGLLYSFLKYTDWPANRQHDRSLVVCIFGDDPFAGALQPMAGRSVNQKEITIRNVHDANQADGCHLLFINADEKNLWPQLSKALAGKNILTVSDFSGFAEAGGMIEFNHRDNHISAELNPQAVASEQLAVQDRLLKLTTIVHSAPSFERKNP